MDCLAKAIVIVLALLIGGCFGLDSDQVRICRMVPVALHDLDGTVAISATRAGAVAQSVEIAYTHTSAATGQSQHLISCRFGGGRWSRDRQELVGLTSDGHRFREANLYFLKRFWLNEPHAALLAPKLSRQEMSGVMELGRNAAVASQHVLAALPKIAIYAMLAPAYALIYGLIGRVNLAFGELAVLGGQGAILGAVATNMLLPDGSMLWSLIAAVLVAMAIASLHSALAGRLIFTRLVHHRGQAITVASFGLAIACMEYIRLAQGSGNTWMPPMLNTSVVLAHHDAFLVTITEGGIAAIGLAGVVATALIVAMQTTAFGRRWRAVSDDRLAAELLGISARQVLLWSFTIAGLLAGLSGAVVFAHYGGIGFSGGLVMGLKALVGAVIGGLGSVPGAILGALMIGAFEGLWSSLFPIEQSDIAILAVLILFLILRPEGLFGSCGRNQNQV